LTCPVPVDAAYYYSVAENLHQGRGFVIDYAWNYLRGIPESLPVPSNDYWQPLASIMLALGFAVAPVSWVTAQAVAVFFGCLLALMALWFAWRVSGSMLLGLLAGIYVAVMPDAVFASNTTDTPVFFAVFGGAALMAAVLGFSEFARARPGEKPARLLRYFVAIGVLCALGYLTRSDGALILLTATFFFLRFRKDRSLLSLEVAPDEAAPGQSCPRVGTEGVSGENAEGRKGGTNSAAAFPAWWLLMMWGVFMVVVCPWLVRNYLAFGSPLPGGFLKAALVAKYADFFTSQPEKLTLSYYLSHGSVYNFSLKFLTLGNCIAKLTEIYGWLVLGLALWELCAGRRRPTHLPMLFHLVVVLVLTSFVLTLVALKGTFHHMIPIFIPLMPAYALLGVKRFWGKVRLARKTYFRWGLATFAVALVPVLVLLRLRGSSLDLYGLTRLLEVIGGAGLVVALVAVVCRRLDFRWGAAAAFLGVSAISTVSVFRFPVGQVDYCERKMQLQRNAASFVERVVKEEGAVERPIFSDNPWDYYYAAHKPSYSIPLDPYDRIREVARKLGVEYMAAYPGVLPRFPDLAERLEQDTSVVLLGVVYPFKDLPDSRFAASLPTEQLKGKWNEIEASRKKGEAPVEKVEMILVFKFLDGGAGGQRLSPLDIGRLHHRSGKMLVMVGQFEQAVISFRKALRCAPDVPDAYANLARALLEYARDKVERTRQPLGQVAEFGEALANARKAMEMAPGREDFRRLVAEIGEKMRTRASAEVDSRQ